MKQKYYIKATKDGMKAGYNGYQHRLGITKHPNPNKTDKLCSDGFHMAKSFKDALSYLNNATEFYLCKPVGKIYAEDNTKIRAGRINILWKIPIEKFPAWCKARATCDKAHVALVNAAWCKARATLDKAHAPLVNAALSKANATLDKANATLVKANATIIMDDIIKMYEESKYERH